MALYFDNKKPPFLFRDAGLLQVPETLMGDEALKGMTFRRLELPEIDDSLFEDCEGPVQVLQTPARVDSFAKRLLDGVSGVFKQLYHSVFTRHWYAGDLMTRKLAISNLNGENKDDKLVLDLIKNPEFLEESRRLSKMLLSLDTENGTERLCGEMDAAHKAWTDLFQKFAPKAYESYNVDGNKVTEQVTDPDVLQHVARAFFLSDEAAFPHLMRLSDLLDPFYRWFRLPQGGSGSDVDEAIQRAGRRESLYCLIASAQGSVKLLAESDLKDCEDLPCHTRVLKEVESLKPALERLRDGAIAVFRQLFFGGPRDETVLDTAEMKTYRQGVKWDTL